MDWTDIVIGGFPLAILVVGLVNLAKKLGLPADYAPYLNGLLASIGFGLVTYVIPNHPEVEPILIFIAGVVFTFLSASGIHQLGKTD